VSDNLSFTKATSEATGKDKRTIQRAAARGEALGDDLNDIAGTSLDKGVSFRWKVIRSFITESGCRSCALAVASSRALGTNRRRITHTSISKWAAPAKSSAPTALRYFVSMRAWAQTKLIRQIVLTVTWTEVKGGSRQAVMTPDWREYNAPGMGRM
jgi:hypothetical protein